MEVRGSPRCPWKYEEIREIAWKTVEVQAILERILENPRQSEELSRNSEERRESPGKSVAVRGILEEARESLRSRKSV